MKKVLATLVAVVMLVSLFSLVSHAEYMGRCFDGAFLTNNAEANTHVPTSEEKDVKNDAHAGDVGNIYGLGYSYIHVQGWLTDDDEFEDIGFQVNDGEITWGKGTYDSNIIGLTGGTYALRFNFNITIIEGDVKVTFYEKLKSGDAKEAHAFTYVNKEPDPNEKKFSNVAILDNGGGAIGTWLNTKNDTAYVEFTTAGAFKGISLGVYWASNPNVPNGPKADWKFELFKFEYNVENTLAQNPVKTKTVTSSADNDPAFKFDFGEEMPAGTYIAKFTITNPDKSEVFVVNGEESSKNPYLVLPKIDNPDDSKFTYYNDPFNIVLNAEAVDGAFFLANPEDTAAPAKSIIDESKYDVSYKINKDNATNWANGNINGIDVTYFFKVEDDGLAVAVRGIGLKDGEYVQLNFNPGNYLWEVPGQFISVVLGENLKVMQHNHKNGLLADDNPGGADITD
ncbi:MAG: hypothetical protein J5950_01590, partial [Clostridia bacterium]|nr:hypothetical protein [Clostridia bacterium]